MSQYTPTTQGVLLAATFPRTLTLGAPCHLTQDEFNRWLTKTIQQAKETAWDEGAGVAWRESGIRTYGNEYTELPENGFIPFSVNNKNPYRKQP